MYIVIEYAVSSEIVILGSVGIDVVDVDAVGAVALLLFCIISSFLYYDWYVFIFLEEQMYGFNRGDLNYN